MNLKILVTGTGRCGTNFMANLLTSMGWPCGHEAVFTPMGLGWALEVLKGVREPKNSDISRDGTILSEGMVLVGDSSYASAPFLGEADAGFVVHLVRNPMKVIASMIGPGFRNFAEPFPVDYEEFPDHIVHERFIYQTLPDLGEEMPQLDRACTFYLRWNEMIESSGKVDLFHRVEDRPERIKKVVGFSGDDFYSDKTCNSFSKKSRPWAVQQISSPTVRKQFRDMMKRYGYKEPPRLI